MTLIDTHCHIGYGDFDGDRDAVLARAKDAGVAGMLSVATDPDCWTRYLDVAGPRPEVLVALGFHPNYADSYSDAECARMKDLFANHPGKAVAVGETGLDFFRDHCAPEAQQRAFQVQLDLAAALDLPFILHCRNAERAMCDVLKAQQQKLGRPLKGVWHCFTATVEFMHEAVALGLHLGFGGVTTYPKAENVREAAREAPANRLLLETDAPYLPPQPWRGQRNEPGYVNATAETLAKVRCVSFEEIADLTTTNARRLFASW